MRAEMARQGIGPTQLANKLNIRRATLSNKLNGHSTFNPDEISTIAQKLGITASELTSRAEQALDTTPPNPTNNPPALADSGRVVSFVLDGRELHINETKAEQVFEHMQVCQVCNGFEQAFAHVRDFQEGL